MLNTKVVATTAAVSALKILFPNETVFAVSAMSFASDSVNPPSGPMTTAISLPSFKLLIFDGVDFSYANITFKWFFIFNKKLYNYYYTIILIIINIIILFIFNIKLFFKYNLLPTAKFIFKFILICRARTLSFSLAGSLGQDVFIKLRFIFDFYEAVIGLNA